MGEREETRLSRTETMKTLKEFLHERAEIERGHADEKKVIQQEWIGSIHRLVEIEEKWRKLREIDVGVYTAPGLVIRLEAQEVRVIPVARMVVGPDLSNGLIRADRAIGRLDLTDGDKRFLLFRSRNHPVDEWVVLEDEGYTFKRFDRQVLEEAMQSLLR
jgi:hypothetical protein